MSLFSRVLGRNSTYVLGIVLAAFVIDRTVEIGAEQVWKSSNKGVSIPTEVTHFNHKIVEISAYEFLSIFMLGFIKQLTFEEIKDRFSG